MSEDVSTKKKLQALDNVVKRRKEKMLKKRQEFIESKNKLSTDKTIPKPKSEVFDKKNPKLKTKTRNIIDTKAVAKMTPIGEFKADREMIRRYQASKTVEKKAGDILKTADVAIKKGDKNTLKKLGKLAEKTGDKETLKQLMKKVSKSNMVKKASKKLLSAIPFVGGLAAALATGDASAAIPDVPGITDIESLGPKKGTFSHELETADFNKMSEAQRKEFIKKLRKNRFIQKSIKGKNNGNK